MTDEPNTQIVGKQQQHITQSTENKNNNGPHLLSHSRWISCCINMTAHTVLIVYDINAFAACFPLNSIRECCLIARIQTTNTFHRTLYHLSASYNLSTFYISCNTNFPFRSHFFLLHFIFGMSSWARAQNPNRRLMKIRKDFEMRFVGVVFITKTEISHLNP